MLKRVLFPLATFFKQTHRLTLPLRYNYFLQTNNKNFFSFQKGLTPSNVPQQNVKVRASTATIGQEEVQVFKTEGGVSIMQKVPGVKAANGQLYVLKFTCTQCNVQSIRSFTKHSYHKGVVMVRCGGCDKIHLVADNLGWFQDQPSNLDTLYNGQVKKVHDQVAIVKFLQKAFEEDAVNNKIKKQDLSVDESSNKGKEV